MMNKLKGELTKHFLMKDLGEAYLVLRISIKKSNGTINVLRVFAMDNYNPVCSTVVVNQKISLEMCPASEKEKGEMKNVPYIEAVGCLLYSAQNTRSIRYMISCKYAQETGQKWRFGRQ